MKKQILYLTVLLMSTICFAQESFNQTDISNHEELNYVFSRLNTDNIYSKTMFNGGLFVKVFTISDSKITPDNFSEGTDEFLESLFVSISPDGDSYTGSRLIKIEGLQYPQIIEISELDYPKMTLTLEVGNKDYRKKIKVQL